MVYQRAWAMPNKFTFRISPIREFVFRYTSGCAIVVDPFCGSSAIANYRNDLGAGGVDAEVFVRELVDQKIRADAILFDPPYSPRQISECYKSIGKEVTGKDTQNAALYARVRKPCRVLLKPGGVALSFGWNSTGFGKDWPILEQLNVCHGGAHNDTICIAQRKPFDLLETEHG